MKFFLTVFFPHEIQPVSHSSLPGILWFQWVQFWLVLLGCCTIMWVGWPVSVEGSMNCRLIPRHKWFLFGENSGCQFSTVSQSRPTPCDPMNRSTPGLPVYHQLLDFTQTHVHQVTNATQPSHPLSSPSSAPNLSQHQGLFHWVNSSREVPRYWSFSISISPSNEHPGLISFRMDWLDLLAVQGTLKNILQYHSSKASILPCSAFFTVQLSRPYMTTGKIIALTSRTFVGKVISLLFNMLSRLVITFLPRSKSLTDIPNTDEAVYNSSILEYY